MKYSLFFFFGIALFATSALRAESLQKQLVGKLVVLKDKELQPAPGDVMKDKDIIIIYFGDSKSSRTVTSHMSMFHSESMKKYSNFQMVLVSGDKDEEAMRLHMYNGDMKNPAVRFSDIEKSGLEKYAASKRPYIVVLDSDGKILMEKPKGKNWIHPFDVFRQVEAIVKEKGKKITP
ncbi:MAG: thioredoxin family protein [Opitutales bacterium]